MINREILQQLKTQQDWLDFVNSHKYKGQYLVDTNLLISINGAKKETLRINNISNAFKRGKMCDSYTLECHDFNNLMKIVKHYNYNSESLLEAFQKIKFSTNQYDNYEPTTFEGSKLYKTDTKGVYTFSPFLLNRLKPLKEVPKKWAISHVKRLLANDQFKNLRTSQRLTDDYAFDAAYDFGRGALHRDTMLIELVENSRGWWVSGAGKDGDELGINCHHFDYKKCELYLDGAKKVRKSRKSKKTVERKNITPLVTRNNPNVKPAGILML